MSISIPCAGELTKRVSLIARTDTPNGSFGVISSDTTLATVWAKIEPVGGSTYFNGVQQNVVITHRIWMRSIKNKTDVYSIKNRVLIKHNGRMYQPKRVTDANGCGVWTVIEAQELGNDTPETVSSIVSEALNG